MQVQCSCVWNAYLSRAGSESKIMWGPAIGLSIIRCTINQYVFNRFRFEQTQRRVICTIYRMPCGLCPPGVYTLSTYYIHTHKIYINKIEIIMHIILVWKSSPYFLSKNAQLKLLYGRLCVSFDSFMSIESSFDSMDLRHAVNKNYVKWNISCTILMCMYCVCFRVAVRGIRSLI